MGKPISNPGFLAATIAGGAVGTAGGFMSTGERLEENGESDFRQVTGAVGGGIKYGAIGAGAGLGVATTAYALKRILGK